MKEARPHWDKAQAIPATVALVTFLIIVVALYLLKLKRWGFGRSEGTAYVTDYDGQTVRRSTRSRKSVPPQRWSPDDLASPTGMRTPGSTAKQTQDAVVSAAKKAEKEVVDKVVTPVAAAVKRGPGRPPKTPKSATPAAAAEPSVIRTRAGARTPAK